MATAYILHRRYGNELMETWGQVSFVQNGGKVGEETREHVSLSRFRWMEESASKIEDALYFMVEGVRCEGLCSVILFIYAENRSLSCCSVRVLYETWRNVFSNILVTHKNTNFDISEHAVALNYTGKVCMI